MKIVFPPDVLDLVVKRSGWVETNSNSVDTRNFLAEGKACKTCGDKGHPERPISIKSEWNVLKDARGEPVIKEGTALWNFSWATYVCSHQRAMVLANGAVNFQPVQNLSLLGELIMKEKKFPSALGAHVVMI